MSKHNNRIAGNLLTSILILSGFTISSSKGVFSIDKLTEKRATEILSAIVPVQHSRILGSYLEKQAIPDATDATLKNVIEETSEILLLAKTDCFLPQGS